MFKKFDGGAQGVMTDLVLALGDEYQQWYRQNGGYLGYQKKKLSRYHINSLLQGAFWEMQEEELVPARVDLMHPNDAAKQLQGRLYVAPRFDQAGDPQPEYFLVTLKEDDGYKMFLTDRENMHRVKESLKPNAWDRLCDKVRKLFGSRDKVCKRWEEKYRDMKIFPERAAQAQAAPAQKTRHDPAKIAQQVEEADLPLTEIGIGEDAFLRQDLHARSEQIGGREQLTGQVNFRPKMFLSVLSGGVRLPSEDGKRNSYEQDYLSAAVSLLARPVTDPTRGIAAGTAMEEIDLSDREKMVRHMTRAQNELMMKTDLLSPRTRMMFDIYDAAERVSRAGEGPEGLRDLFRSDNCALMNLRREELQAFRSLCRCYRDMNNASHVKEAILKGEITEDQLPRAAIVLQKGKQAETLLESLNGTSFYRMTPQQQEQLRAYAASSLALTRSEPVLQAAKACMKSGDYMGSLRSLSDLVQRNGLIQVLSAQPQAQPNQPAQAQPNQHAQPKAPEQKKKAPGRLP